MICEILNTGDNVDDKEDFGITGSYLKTAPTDKDNFTKNTCLNMQREILIPQIYIEKNGKQSDEG